MFQVSKYDCTPNAFFLSVCLRLGWCCSDIPFTPLTSVTNKPGETAPSHWPPDGWIDDFLLQERKKKQPTAHFYFLTFWTLTCTTAARRGGRESLPALPPPSFTWTLSHCSYHPKQHICHLRAVLIVPNTHTHKNSWHSLLDTKHSLLAYLQTYHTCVNKIKHYCGWCPNTYRLESTGLFYS